MAATSTAAIFFPFKSTFFKHLKKIFQAIKGLPNCGLNVVSFALK